MDKNTPTVVDSVILHKAVASLEMSAKSDMEMADRDIQELLKEQNEITE